MLALNGEPLERDARKGASLWELCSARLHKFLFHFFFSFFHLYDGLRQKKETSRNL